MREFRIAEPRTAAELAALLAETTEPAAMMAGGTDLLDELKSGVAEARAGRRPAAGRGAGRDREGEGRAADRGHDPDRRAGRDGDRGQGLSRA